MTNNQSNELRTKYPINTFHGTTQDELVEFILDRERQARIDELEEVMKKHSRTCRQTITDNKGGVYSDDTQTYISKYEVQERVYQLSTNSRKDK